MRVILLCHAETKATASTTFPGDEPLTARGRARAAELTAPRAELLLHAPSTQCRETAEALGLGATAEPALNGCDHGIWRGRAIDDVLSTEHEALTRWLTDPSAAPHGGEPVTGLIKRAGAWLDGLDRVNSVLAIAEQSFIRAALVHAIDAKPSCYWRIDIAPLERVVLTGRIGRWHLHVGG